MEPSMHNVKILHDSHIPENPLVPRRHHPLYSTFSRFLAKIKVASLSEQSLAALVEFWETLVLGSSAAPATPSAKATYSTSHCSLGYSLL